MSKVNVGDRVVIKSVASRLVAKYVNLIGTVVTLLPSGRLIVETAGPNPTRVIATAVEPVVETLASAKDQSDYTTGDIVRIVQTHYNDGRSRASVGKVGTIKNITYLNGRPDTFFVEVGGETYPAAKVEPAPAYTPSHSEPEPGPYTVRLQAAKDAVAVIGDGASIEEITTLSEWMLNVPELEDAKPDFAVASWLTYEAKAAKGGTLADITAAERLANEGTTVRLLEVSLDDSFDDDVVEVSLNSGTTYLADDDINELVDYLRAAQVVQAARRAASES